MAAVLARHGEARDAAPTRKEVSEIHFTPDEPDGRPARVPGRSPSSGGGKQDVVPLVLAGGLLERERVLGAERRRQETVARDVHRADRNPRPFARRQILTRDTHLDGRLEIGETKR